jgi:hypothetical protein
MVVFRQLPISFLLARAIMHTEDLVLVARLLDDTGCACFAGGFIEFKDVV